MDFAIQTAPQSAYEYIVQQPVDSVQSQSIKNEAFKMMDQLEGWCTQYKASILIDLIIALQPKVVVEVGVFGGKSLIPMAYALKQIGNGKIYGIDPWKNYASAVGLEDEHLDWWQKLDHEKIMNDFLAKVREFRLQRQVKVIRATSEEAPQMSNIDMIYIDGNHSEEMAYYDVTKWVPMVRSGGIVIFDDLDWPDTAKAKQWLDENCEPGRIVQEDSHNIWGIWVKK